MYVVKLRLVQLRSKQVSRHLPEILRFMDIHIQAATYCSTCIQDSISNPGIFHLEHIWPRLRAIFKAIRLYRAVNLVSSSSDLSLYKEPIYATMHVSEVMPKFVSTMFGSELLYLLQQFHDCCIAILCAEIEHLDGSMHMTWLEFCQPGQRLSYALLAIPSCSSLAPGSQLQKLVLSHQSTSLNISLQIDVRGACQPQLRVLLVCFRYSTIIWWLQGGHPESQALRELRAIVLIVYCQLKVFFNIVGIKLLTDDDPESVAGWDSEMAGEWFEISIVSFIITWSGLRDLCSKSSKEIKQSQLYCKLLCTLAWSQKSILRQKLAMQTWKSAIQTTSNYCTYLFVHVFKTPVSGTKHLNANLDN